MTPAVGVAADGESEIAQATMRAVSLRLLPFLFILYIFNYLDRSNVAIAALQMNRDLGFSGAAYGLAAGIFFLGYVLFEVPSIWCCGFLLKTLARNWTRCSMRS